MGLNRLRSVSPARKQYRFTTLNACVKCLGGEQRSAPSPFATRPAATNPAAGLARSLLLDRRLQCECFPAAVQRRPSRKALEHRRGYRKFLRGFQTGHRQCWLEDLVEQGWAADGSADREWQESPDLGGTMSSTSATLLKSACDGRKNMHRNVRETARPRMTTSRRQRGERAE